MELTEIVIKKIIEMVAEKFIEKVKEWKEKFVNAVKGVFAPAPQPSPVPCE